MTDDQRDKQEFSGLPPEWEIGNGKFRLKSSGFLLIKQIRQDLYHHFPFGISRLKLLKQIPAYRYTAAPSPAQIVALDAVGSSPTTHPILPVWRQRWGVAKR